MLYNGGLPKIKRLISLQNILIVILILIIINGIIHIVKTQTTQIESFRLKTPTYYIFWTGGYDSTFRILEALLVNKAVVVPIYLSGVIDNKITDSTRRKNNKQELEALRIIRKEIYNKYPSYASYLKPLVIIPNVTISKQVSTSMDILYRKQMVRRPVCQYGALSQVSLDMNHPIELAVEKDPTSSMMYNSVYDKVDVNKIGPECKILNSVMNQYPELEIYKHFRFSTLHLSKKDMLTIARKNGFHNILEMTWSCWYPQNGKPCQRCIMCKDRIV